MHIQEEEKYIDTQDIIVLQIQINNLQGLHQDRDSHEHRRRKHKSRSPTSKMSTFSGTLLSHNLKDWLRGMKAEMEKIGQIIELFRGFGIRICV